MSSIFTIILTINLLLTGLITSLYSSSLPDINGIMKAEEPCLSVVDRNGKQLYKLDEEGLCIENKN